MWTQKLSSVCTLASLIAPWVSWQESRSVRVCVLAFVYSCIWLLSVCLCVYACACVRVCVCACVRVCVWACFFFCIRMCVSTIVHPIDPLFLRTCAPRPEGCTMTQLFWNGVVGKCVARIGWVGVVHFPTRALSDNGIQTQGHGDVWYKATHNGGELCKGGGGGGGQRISAYVGELGRQRALQAQAVC